MAELELLSHEINWEHIEWVWQRKSRNGTLEPFVYHMRKNEHDTARGEHDKLRALVTGRIKPKYRKAIAYIELTADAWGRGGDAIVRVWFHRHQLDQLDGLPIDVKCDSKVYWCARLRENVGVIPASRRGHRTDSP